MQSFLSRHREQITGVISGFDRVVFRGLLRQLSYSDGLLSFLNYRGVRLVDFRDFVTGLTSRIVKASEGLAQKYDRPFKYLQSSNERKEDIVRTLLKKNPVEQGLICVLKCVEPCM